MSATTKKEKLAGEIFTAETVNSYGKLDRKHESPINFSFSIMKKITLPLLEWNNENVPPRLLRLTNTGESVLLSGKWFGPRPFLCKGPLLGKYIFSQMHFHWGPLDVGGSEHTFDGVRMPLEIHVVFFKSDYICQEEAYKKNDGVLSMVFLTELQDEDSYSLKPIVDSLYKIGRAGLSQNIDLFPITQFFPPFFDDFYMYWGNIINVYNVLWIICKKPLPISANQVELFRYIRNHDRQTIKTNFRSTKPIEGRMVFYVNPNPLTAEFLIIPLEELEGLKLKSEKKIKNKTTTDCKRKSITECNNNKKKDNIEEECSNNNCCFTPSFSKSSLDEESSSDEEEQLVKCKPSIEKSDIESNTSRLKVIYDNISEKNEESIEIDSLTSLTTGIDMKQKVNETNDQYLFRIETHLKTLMAKVESKKMKLVNDDGQLNEKDEQNKDSLNKERISFENVKGQSLAEENTTKLTVEILKYEGNRSENLEEIQSHDATSRNQSLPMTNHQISIDGRLNQKDINENNLELKKRKEIQIIEKSRLGNDEKNVVLLETKKSTGRKDEIKQDNGNLVTCNKPVKEIGNKFPLDYDIQTKKSQSVHSFQTEENSRPIQKRIKKVAPRTAPSLLNSTIKPDVKNEMKLADKKAMMLNNIKESLKKKTVNKNINSLRKTQIKSTLVTQVFMNNSNKVEGPAVVPAIKKISKNNAKSDIKARPIWKY